MSILTQESAVIASAPVSDSSVPRVYIACLASYCAGKLHGAWVDCDQDSYCIQFDIDEIIASSPEGEDAEEWAIHGYENWEGISLSEHESVEYLAELAQTIKEHGKAYAAYYNHMGSGYATVQDFQDAYQGVYESEAAFIEQQWEESGKLDELEKMGVSSMYIDFDAIARDWFVNDYFSIDVGYNEVYVFANT